MYGTSLPSHYRVNGTLHRLVILHVKSKHDNGIPKDCEVVQDPKATPLQNGKEYITCYVPIIMMTSKQPTEDKT